MGSGRSIRSCFTLGEQAASGRSAAAANSSVWIAFMMLRDLVIMGDLYWFPRSPAQVAGGKDGKT